MQRAAVQQGVQGTRGCRGEAAVFDCLEVSRGVLSRAEPRLQRVIGQRRRVQRCAVEATEPLEALLPRWIAPGVQRREARPLNRVRRVLGGPASDWQESVQALLERLPLPDERVHVHVVLPLAPLLALEQSVDPS